MDGHRPYFVCHYLKSVRAEVDKGEPNCAAGKFDDSFEKDYPLETEMPKHLLQKHMFAEFVEFSNKLNEEEEEETTADPSTSYDTAGI
jgi:hypothetical protein